MQEIHGVTAIIFDENRGRRFFLVLHRVLNWRGWEFVKGGIDKGEAAEEAVFREIDEETGLKDVSLVSPLPEKISWTANGTKYIYTPFIFRGNMSEKPSLEQEIIEHDDFTWAEESEVESLLTHEDNRKVFREALAILGGSHAKG